MLYYNDIMVVYSEKPARKLIIPPVVCKSNTKHSSSSKIFFIFLNIQ